MTRELFKNEFIIYTISKTYVLFHVPQKYKKPMLQYSGAYRIPNSRTFTLQFSCYNGFVFFHNYQFLSNVFTLQIIGLGNIDRPDTRHSVGMKLIDRLAVCLDTTWTCSKATKSYVARKKLSFNSQQSDGLPETSEIFLMKSVLPMNANGRSVKKTGDH